MSLFFYARYPVGGEKEGKEWGSNRAITVRAIVYHYLETSLSILHDRVWMKGKKVFCTRVLSYLALLSSLTNRPLFSVCISKPRDTNCSARESCDGGFVLSLTLLLCLSLYVFLKCCVKVICLKVALFFFFSSNTIGHYSTVTQLYVAKCIKAICDIRVTEIMMDFKINVDDSDHSVIIIYLVVGGR